jgi:hypothetical protein
MYIYRIQSEDGMGCIWGDHTYRYPEELLYIRSSSLSDGSERREHPGEDGETHLAKAYWNKKIYQGGPLRFGFASQEDLWSWFSPVEIGWHELNGYFIHIFEVPKKKVIFGSHQVCFDPTHAISVQKIPHTKLRHL